MKLVAPCFSQRVQSARSNHNGRGVLFHLASSSVLNHIYHACVVAAPPTVCLRGAPLLLHEAMLHLDKPPLMGISVSRYHKFTESA